MRGAGFGADWGGSRIYSPYIVSGSLLLFICLTAMSPQAAEPPRDKHIAQTRHLAAPHTAPWYLEVMRRLLHQGRAAESHQLAQVAVARFPHSPDIRLAAAYAAVDSRRCALAKLHLAALGDAMLAASLTREHHRQRDSLQAHCDGPWRRRLAIEMTTGYRPSLSDRARRFEMRLEPGSRLHGLCVRLRGLCDPDRRFTGGGRRDSGIDVWMQLRLAHRYRAGTAWDVDITPLIFRRMPSRSGHEGRGAILRAEAWRHLHAGRKLHVLAETGVAGFQQGDPALSFSQSHRRVSAAFVMPHTPFLASHIGHGRTWVRSRWLDLRQWRTEYRLHLRPHDRLSVWTGFAAERASQTGPGRLAGSRSQVPSVGGQYRLPRATLTVWHEWRRQRFAEPLSYLAAPHRASTRITGLELMPDLPEKTNVKVVLSLNYRKISSPDVALPSTTKTLMVTFRYLFDGAD